MNDVLDGEAKQLLPVSTRVCAACGELDRGIYLTEKNKMLFLAIQILHQAAPSIGRNV